jgi:inorganic triphosphatase YgiF
LDFPAITDPKLRKFFANEILQHALHPVFTTEFTRSRRMVELPNGEIVEFSLDRGEIRANNDQLPICEVELELKSGDPARLFEFALSLQATIPLRLENASKAERGYRLVTHAQLTPVKAKTPILEKDLSVHEAFARILQSCLTHLQANEEGMFQSDDVEFVHQMRVALRRMRSALNIFSDLVPSEKTEPIRQEMRWLAGELDGARNWDVCEQETLPPIVAAFPNHEGLAELQRRSAEIRRQHNEQARSAVASSRYQKFLLTIGAWLCSPPASTAIEPANEPSLAEFAATILQKRHKQLKKRGKHIVSLSPAERHKVRIAAKKLRYAAEFFSSLYPRKHKHAYIAALADLQDVLGILNDAATTANLLQEIQVTEEAGSQQQAKDLILGWVGGASHTKLQELESVWRNFVDQKTF